MRILIIQDGITTELRAPDTLAGLVWAVKDHFDHIDKGSMSVIWDKPAAAFAADTGGEFKSPPGALRERQKTQETEDTAPRDRNKTRATRGKIRTSPRA